MVLVKGNNSPYLGTFEASVPYLHFVFFEGHSARVRFQREGFEWGFFGGMCGYQVCYGTSDIAHSHFSHVQFVDGLLICWRYGFSAEPHRCHAGHRPRTTW